MILVRGTDDGFKKNVISHLKKLASLDLNQEILFLHLTKNFVLFQSVRISMNPKKTTAEICADFVIQSQSTKRKAIFVLNAEGEQ